MFANTLKYSDEEHDDDDEEEEWFYDSMRRYKQLHMFDFENVITHLALVSPTSICVVERSRRNDLLELCLPQKLTVAPHEKGMVKNSDLKVLNGGFTAAPVTEMKVFPNKRRVIASEEKQLGATIYSLGENGSGLTSKSGHISCQLVSPYIALNDKDIVLLSSTNGQEFVIADVVANKTVARSFPNCIGFVDGGIEPCFVSSNVAAFCERTTGNIFLQDIRKETYLIENALIKSRTGVSGALWTLTSNWNTDTNCESPKVCLASNRGSLFVYDFRNMKSVLCEANVKVPTENSSIEQKLPTLQFHPKDDTKLSLSGFDKNVYIFNVSCTDNFNTIFVHNGHGKQAKSGVDSTVTSHVWYQEDIVISASEDKWLHCWQFVAGQA